MKTKTYRAASEISLTVNIGKCRTKHIRFDVLSNGGSEYKTSDRSLQKALENHSRYGELFNCVSMETANEQKKEETPVPVEMKIKVSSMVEAKDYLVEQKGIERTRLKDKESIFRMAEKNGIVFVGI